VEVPLGREKIGRIPAHILGAKNLGSLPHQRRNNRGWIRPGGNYLGKFVLFYYFIIIGEFLPLGFVVSLRGVLRINYHKL